MLNISTKNIFMPGGFDGTNPEYCHLCYWHQTLHGRGMQCPEPGTTQPATVTPGMPQMPVPASTDQGWLVPFSVGSLWSGMMFLSAAALAVSAAIIYERNSDKNY